MNKYREIYYFKDIDELWKVVYNGSKFIVALDDSKNHFNKKIIKENNNPEKCKEYIDWLLK